MPSIAVIPARFGSTRFPGKPLADRTGKPLIQHVYDRVRGAKRVARIVVATDDVRILEAVTRFGGEAVMTGEHPNGTSRIDEAVRTLGDTETDAVVVNVQGDEPDIEPSLIDDLVEAMERDPDAPMGTVASPFAGGEDPTDPNLVKVVVGRHGRALYFSRSLLPYPRVPGCCQPLKHVGLYAYRRWFLERYVALPPSPLEQAESLEQLRVLEHGFPITVIERNVSHHGIDTPEQYDAFVRRHAK